MNLPRMPALFIGHGSPMLAIEPDNLVEYLHTRGQLDHQVAARAELLAWGVSNAVLRVTPAAGEAFVVVLLFGSEG